jgi:hypothetical protein
VDETVHWVKDVWVNEFEKKFVDAKVDGKVLMALTGNPPHYHSYGINDCMACVYI